MSNANDERDRAFAAWINRYMPVEIYDEEERADALRLLKEGYSAALKSELLREVREALDVSLAFMSLEHTQRTKLEMALAKLDAAIKSAGGE